MAPQRGESPFGVSKACAGATSPNPQVEAAIELLRAIRVAWRAEMWQLGAGVPRIWAM